MKRLLGLCATVLAALCLTGCASQKKVAYLCAYMTGDDERHLYYAVADTAFRFHPVNDGQPVLGASFDDRLVRDPHLFRDRQGCYHMVATVSWKNHPFTIWDSRERLVTRANVEGPYVFPLNDGTGYAIVWDYYGGSKGFGLATSKDLHEWHSVTNRRHPYYNDSVCFPHGIRHGSIMGITKRQLKAINNMRKQTK